MKTILTLASVTALAAASMSATAWWAAPYAYPALTAEQQQAMVEQQTKAMEQMMAAHRQMVEAMHKRMPEQGFGPMGFPGDAPFFADPWGQDSFSMPEMPGFGQFPAMPEMPEMPQLGQFPEMPELGQFPPMPELGQFPAMPEMPAPYGAEIPHPAVPGFAHPRYQVIQAQRAKSMADAKARRDQAFQAMNERRRAAEAQRAERPYRFARPHLPYGLSPLAPQAVIPAAPVAAPTTVDAAPATDLAAAAIVESAPAADLAPMVEAAAVAPAPVAQTPASN